MKITKNILDILYRLKILHLISYVQKKYFKLGGVGLYTLISLRAEFKGNTRNIFIGCRCRVEANVLLECEGNDALIKFGDNSIIRRGAILITGCDGTIKTGSHFSVNPYSVIYGHGGLSVGDYVRIATHVVIIPANHIYAEVKTPITMQGLEKKGISIGNDVWLAAGVRVLDGVDIGDGAVIGAGAVVTKSLPEYSVSVGVPAVVVGSRISN